MSLRVRRPQIPAARLTTRLSRLWLGRASIRGLSFLWEIVKCLHVAAHRCGCCLDEVMVCVFYLKSCWCNAWIKLFVSYMVQSSHIFVAREIFHTYEARTPLKTSASIEVKTCNNFEKCLCPGST